MKKAQKKTTGMMMDLIMKEHKMEMMSKGMPKSQKEMMLEKRISKSKGKNTR